MPFSAKQREYFDNANHRWNLKVGATRSGKTYMDYYMIPKRIRARINEPGLSVILGVSKGTIERNILEPMRTIWGSDLVGTISSDNTCRLFGDRVYCLGAEKVSQVAKLRGSSIKYAYGDEVADWNQDVFELLKSRLDKPCSVFDGALNPQGPNHWLKKFIESDADIYNQHYTIFDNPFLPEKFVTDLCKEYEGTVYYKRYILGLWVLAEGLIYDMFKPEEHVVSTLPSFLPGECYVSCDYGTYNATAFLLWKKGANGCWYCCREYYYSGRSEEAQKTDSEYADDLKQWLGPEKPRAIIIDPSAASFIAELRKRGFKTKKARNSVLDGIRCVASLLGDHRIAIHESCTSLIKEFGEYIWDEKASEHGEDKPVKANDHAMDAMRYFCYTIIGKPTGMTIFK